MPTSPEARARKTDRGDAARLARAGLAGQCLQGLGPGVEGLHDACHLLEDLSWARAVARLHVDSLLSLHPRSIGIEVVSAGKFGNGGTRKTALGFRCAEVQTEVNRILDGGSSDSGKGPGNLPGCRALV